MKIVMTHSLHRHLGYSAFTTLLMALACPAATSIFQNRPPTAENLSVVAAANDLSSFIITPIVLKGTDPDGDALTYRVVSPPSDGSLGGTAPNLQYAPSSDFVGFDSFTYVVNDGRREGTSSPATVSISVKHGIFFTTLNTSIIEGNIPLPVSSASFNVRMTGEALDVVTVGFHTADGTAKAGSDYLTTSGSLSFSREQPPVQLIALPVIGDTALEFDETFLVQLFNPSANAVFVTQNSIGQLQTTSQPSISARCTIRDDDGLLTRSVGTAALTPENSVVNVGEPVDLSLTWTHPVGWRKLNSVDLLLVDEEGAILPVRWNEAPNNFSLFNPAADRFVRTAGAGSPTRFETSAATLYLQESTGGGPPGQTVTIQYSLSFKPRAAGRTFSVEAFATDDERNEQGFESVGTITVLPRADDE